ncbi:MAG TPA: hypothetical protein VHF67_14030 [Gaiellaceae bacterium]|jgi:hypothetical protein|nr:hypothetical protein [Gaiellaceae bacterium]
MATADLIVTRETEAERVLEWRLNELIRVGYDRAAAWEIAARSEVDLHLAVELARGGCSPDLALRILL